MVAKEIRDLIKLSSSWVLSICIGQSLLVFVNFLLAYLCVDHLPTSQHNFTLKNKPSLSYGPQNHTSTISILAVGPELIW